MPKRDAAHMAGQRERIMRATIACIAENGVERTSISDIWRKAGVSAGSLYVHFRNKDDIIAATLDHFGTPNDLPAINSWPDFKRVVLSSDTHHEVDRLMATRSRLHLLAGAATPGQLHDSYKAAIGRGMDLSSRLIEGLASAGAITLKMDAARTAAALSAYVDGMWLLALARDQAFDDTIADISEGMDLFVGLPGGA